jgi:hypothetical protein
MPKGNRDQRIDGKKSTLITYLTLARRQIDPTTRILPPLNPLSIQLTSINDEIHEIINRLRAGEFDNPLGFK